MLAAATFAQAQSPTASSSVGRPALTVSLVSPQSSVWPQRVAANGGIALSKFAVFLLTGSSSLLTEAIHSTADCANQVLLFIGMKQGARPASPKHPLGHGQAAFVARP